MFMSPIYGEGANALIRLQGEIDRFSWKKVDSNKLLSAPGAHPIWHVSFTQTSEFVRRADQLQYLKRRIWELIVVKSCLFSVWEV